MSGLHKFNSTSSASMDRYVRLGKPKPEVPIEENEVRTGKGWGSVDSINPTQRAIIVSDYRCVWGREFCQFSSKVLPTCA
eukprot:1187691-Prorocentrum_minimum.AAC.2